MATHTFLKSAFTSLGGANVDAEVLRRTIEANGIIIVALMDGPNALRWADEAADPLYSFAFVSTLPGPQLTELGVIVAAHTGPETGVTASSRTYSRTVNPATTDNEDSIEGFRAGDKWINTTDNTTWELADAVDPAVWKRTDVLGDATDELQAQVVRPSGQILVTTGVGDGTAVVDFEDAEYVTVPAPTNYMETASTIDGQLKGIDAALVFGSQLNLAESTAVSTTTSTTFQLKLRMPAVGDVTLPAGTYLLGISYGWNHNATNSDFEAEIRENDVRIGEHHKQEPKDSTGIFGATGSSQRRYTQREFHRVLSAGDFHWDIRFRTDNGSDQSSIWDVYMRIWRLL